MLNKIAKSKGFDWLGIAIVILAAYFSGYIFENLDTITHWGGISAFVPFGIISVIASIISLMSDRLVCRIKNLGNWIGLIAVVTSGTIDYLLGNKGAIFTYPLTFIIQGWAIKTWMHSERFKAAKPLHGFRGGVIIVLILIASFSFSWWINALGFTQENWLFYTTVLVFGLSLVANIFNALKLTMQWPFWLFYNLVQLVKAFIQGNYANVGKYIYYIVNSLAGLSLWFTSRFDKEQVKS
ncbi:nicotinamide mononucleotide transporter [Acetilactobacillus jinshanensis]|uniref:Nicotinamide mononucleotide transporter n=1 Tax=Acetilactobacillus jinshanensis TaxID=1720083 RepID=A0A4P6ZKN8_9LACO|nr:nicotinamide mononucleotide transporter [Acetilactobacillus jinshanensis]QBP18087.1 hypothetical protein ELX58_02780 [Acetilactobacillus jinshanensis]URL60950.1 nicotinamide mononucleotide transporter [uncultured bacterium]